MRRRVLVLRNVVLAREEQLGAQHGRTTHTTRRAQDEPAMYISLSRSQTTRDTATHRTCIHHAACITKHTDAAYITQHTTITCIRRAHPLGPLSTERQRACRFAWDSPAARKSTTVPDSLFDLGPLIVTDAHASGHARTYRYVGDLRLGCALHRQGARIALVVTIHVRGDDHVDIENLWNRNAVATTSFRHARVMENGVPLRY